MSYSATTTSPQALLKESPSRYHNRYTERFKSLTSTPPREAINYALQTAIRNSTLSEQVTTVETTRVVESEPVKVVEEPVPIPSPPTPPEIPVPKKQIIPAYMQATRSFSNKQQHKKESRQANNPLGPRSKGGITKRVGTAKIPRYQSTTSINAIEDIKNEMTPEDVYIPLAARIKLFEKGLGNGSNPPIISKSSPTASPKPTPRRAATESASPRPPSSASSSRQRLSDASTRSRLSNASAVPHYAQQTAQSLSRQRDIQQSKQQKKEPKPFHFSTSTSFKEKLDLWRHKDKQATIENQKRLHANRKRKRQDQDTTSITTNNHKHPKH